MNSKPVHQQPTTHAAGPRLMGPTPASWTVIAVGIILALGTVVTIVCLALLTPVGRSAAALIPLPPVILFCSMYISACFGGPIEGKNHTF